MAIWIDDRLPRVDAVSDRVDWLHVWLVVGLLLAAAVTAALFFIDLLFHTSFLPSSIPPERSLKGYAAAHAFADRQLLIVGLVAAAYPVMLWLLVRIVSNARKPRGRT